MRRLALFAAFTCSLLLAVPATALTFRRGDEPTCPDGRLRVASHTDLETALDGRAVGVDLALAPGCEDVDVTLVSYELVAGTAPGAQARTVLRDAVTERLSSGTVGHLEVSIDPDCWTLVKLVAGALPPDGLTPGAALAWDRRNTVQSEWSGGPSACAASEAEDGAGGFLGDLLEPPGAATGAPLPPEGRSGERDAPTTSSSPPPTEATPGDERGATSSGGPDGEVAPPATERDATTAPEGATGPTGGDDATETTDPTGDAAISAAPASSEPTPPPAGALPFTGTNAIALFVFALALLMVGLVIVGTGSRHRPRYRGRHLPSRG